MATEETLSRLSHQVSAATWPFTGISTIVFALRTFSRGFLRSDKIALYDIVITFSWVLNIVRAAILQKSCSSIRNVEGPRLPETFPSAAFWVTFTDAWVYFSIGIPKIGIAILVCYLFRPRRGVKIFVLTATALLNVLAAIGFILVFVQCEPVMGQFDPWRYPTARCWRYEIQLIYGSVVSSFSALTDVGFSVWPALVIWKLKMAPKQRFKAMALMSLGIASSVFAILKLHGNVTLIGVTDPLLNLDRALRIALWNSIENDFVIIAASLPSVPPVFRFCHRLWNDHSHADSVTPLRSWTPRKRRTQSSGNTADSILPGGQFPAPHILGAWTGKDNSLNYSRVAE